MSVKKVSGKAYSVSILKNLLTIIKISTKGGNGFKNQNLGKTIKTARKGLWQ